MLRGHGNAEYRSSFGSAKGVEVTVANTIGGGVVARLEGYALALVACGYDFDGAELHVDEPSK